MPRLQIDGADLDYVEGGAGEPILLVHGAWMDLRFWAPQRASLEPSFRVITYSLRYHGTAAWPDDGRNYTVATHVADLARLIEAVVDQPPHLVGLSLGGLFATLLAQRRPELVRSLTLAEPSLPSLIADLPEGKAALAARANAFEPIVAAVRGGDAVRAAALFFEYVNHRGPGAFDRLPDETRGMILDNARTVALLLDALAAGPPPDVSPVMVAQIAAPTLLVEGAQTLRYYTLINDVVAAALPRCTRRVIPDATHLMTSQNPVAFNTALLAFLGSATG